MLTTIVLHDAELGRLSRAEVLAVEYLVHERLSEVARRRRSGDAALLLAIKAAEYLAPLLAEYGDAGCDDLLSGMRDSAIGRTALHRAEQVAALANGRGTTAA